MLPVQRAYEPFNWFAMQPLSNLSLIPRCLLLLPSISKFLVSILLLAVAGCSFEPRIPDRPETPVSLLPTGSEVATITRDEFDIPHIQASDEYKLMAAWGYVHGMDRLWQMDFMHRLALGMSAEVYGQKTLKTDFFVRLIGLSQKAKEVTASLAGTEEYKLLEHYAAGVNRARAELANDLPHQFRAFKVKPLPWSPEATIHLAFLQGLDMTTRTMVTDAHAAFARDKLGDERFTELFSIVRELSKYEATIIHAEDLEASPQTPQERGPDLEASDDASTSGGSNVWAMTGSRTESGHTIVANDTHLAMRNPATWHEVHLQLTDGSLNAYGYAVAGMPVIPAGFTADMAWGVTLGYTNAMDLVSYPMSPDGKSYIGAKGESVAINDFAPDVRFKLGPIVPHVFWKGFQVSAEGIVYPLDIEGQKDRVYVLRWSALDIESVGIRGMLNMLRSKNVKEMKENLQVWTMPSFNFVFGDREGGIGFRQVGMTPKRKQGRQGLTQGDDENEKWMGYLSANEMPALLNPERGYLVSSNNMPGPNTIWKGSYLGEGYRRGFRARRIEEMIESKGTHSFNEIHTMQLDVLVPEARILLPLMLDQLETGDDPELLAVKDLMSKWDYKAEVDAAAMSVFALWKRALKDIIFEQEIELLEGMPLTASRFRPPLDGLYRVLRGEASVDAPLKAALVDSLRLSLKKLLDDLGPSGPGYENWHWGRYHQLTFRSTSGDSRWDLGPYPLGGSERTVAKATEEGEGPFGVRAAASMRFIVELSDPPRGMGSLPGGVRDQEYTESPAPVERWVAGELRPMHFTQEALRTHQKSTGTLIW